MNAVAEMLAEEHVSFGRQVDALADLALECRDLAPAALFARVDKAVGFLTGDLLPHAAAEEGVLYPEIARILGAPDATAPMTHDHVAIRTLVAQLRRHRDELMTPVLPAARYELERVLYSLHAVISLHLAKEDELYLPLLAATPVATGPVPLIEALRLAIADARSADGLAADGG